MAFRLSNQTSFVSLCLWSWLYIYGTEGSQNKTTVEPVLSGTVLSGHPVLGCHPVSGGRLFESRKVPPLSSVRFYSVFASFQRSPLFSGHLYSAVVVILDWVPTACLYCLLPVLNDHLKRNHSNKTKNYSLKSNLFHVYLTKSVLALRVQMCSTHCRLSLVVALLGRNGIFDCVWFLFIGTCI